MLKKSIISAALGLMMLAASPATSFAQDESEQPAPMTEVAEYADGQEEIVAPGVPSEEVNTIPEGPIARKMTQAEKAENVKENDSWGGAITIIAMIIVVGALIVLSILFSCFGKISSALLTKKKLEAQGKTLEDIADNHDVDSGETIAAIAMALSEHFNDQHDMEHTILTIRRLRRAYSPWNSKIYNIRQNPGLNRNESRPLPANKNYR